MTEEEKKERDEKKASRKARRQAKADAELAKDDAYLQSSNPAETAEASGQKTDNEAIDNEPVLGTTWAREGGGAVSVDNPFAKGTAILKTVEQNMNPVTQVKRMAKTGEDLKNGNILGAIGDITGLGGVVEAGKEAYSIAKNGVILKPGESKVYGKKMEEEKKELEEKKAAEPVEAEKAKPTVQPQTETQPQTEEVTEKTEEPSDNSEYDSIMDSINKTYGKAYDKYTDKLPTFMTSAYKNGAFGVPGSADAKTRMGYFIANHLGTTLANTLGGIGNAAMANAGKAATYQEQKSDLDKLNETNLMKGLETTWQNEQGKAQDSLDKIKELTGKDVELYNDRKAQDYFIKQAERIGKNYANLSEDKKAQVVAGELFKVAQRTGDAKALASASAIAELLKPENKEIFSGAYDKLKSFFTNPN